MEVILCNMAGKQVQPIEAIAWYGGLAVTPTWWAYDYDLDQYSVTHIRSGTLIWPGMTDRQAIRLMAALCERLDVDWTASYEELSANTAIVPRVKQIIREIDPLS